MSESREMVPGGEEELNKQGICQHGIGGVGQLCAGVIYCTNEVWEGAEYGELQFPRWQSASILSQSRIRSELVGASAFDFPGKPPP